MRTPRPGARGVLGIVNRGGYDARCESSETHASSSLVSERLSFATEPFRRSADDFYPSPAVSASGTTDGGMTKQPFGRQAIPYTWKCPNPGLGVPTLNPTPTSISVQSSPSALTLDGVSPTDMSWM